MLKPGEVEPYWTGEAEKHLKGRKIVGVRYMTGEEKKEMYWCEKSVVITLDNGTVILVSQDPEGNGPGSLFITTKDGDGETLPSI